MHHILSLYHGEGIPIFKSSVNLDLRIIYRNLITVYPVCFRRFGARPYGIHLKRKFTGGHPAGYRLLKVLTAQKVIQNTGNPHNVDCSGFRTDIIDINRLIIIRDCRLLYTGHTGPRDQISRPSLLRKICIEIKIPYHIGSPCHRQDAQTAAEDGGKRFPRIKLRHQPRLFILTNLIGRNIKGAALRHLFFYIISVKEQLPLIIYYAHNFSPALHQ